MTSFKCIWIKILSTNSYLKVVLISCLFPLIFGSILMLSNPTAFSLPQQILPTVCSEKSHFSLSCDSACAAGLPALSFYSHSFPPHAPLLSNDAPLVLSAYRHLQMSFNPHKATTTVHISCRGELLQKAPLQAFPFPSLASWVRSAFLSPSCHLPLLRVSLWAPHMHMATAHLQLASESFCVFSGKCNLPRYIC